MTHQFDRITVEELRSGGGKKWVEFPETTGAWIAEMDYGTAPAVTQALRRAVDGEGLGYLPSGRLTALRSAFVEFTERRFGWHVQAADVGLAPDVLTVLQMSVRFFSRPGSPVVLPTPAYMPFLTLPGMLDREIIQVPLARDGDRYVYDLDALDAAFAAGGDLLVLCNPHNPVGRVLEADELTAISEVVDRHGGRVFADEIHAPLTYAPHRHLPYASISEVTAGHTITAMSGSKAFNLPGLKCAQVVLSNDADRAVWAERGHLAADQASTIGALASTAAYADGDDWLDGVVDYLDGNRRVLAELVAEHLPGAGYTMPEGTYLAWLDFRELGIEEPGVWFRSHAQVAATSGSACGEAGRGFLRLNIAMPRPVLVEAVARMGEAVAAR